MSILKTTDAVPAETWWPETEARAPETQSPARIEWPSAPPSAALSAPQRTPRRRLLLAALLGFLGGALAVSGLWLGTARLGGPSNEAARACSILEGLPTFTTESLALSDGADLRKAGDLSATAARHDQQYNRLADATRQAYLASTDLDSESVNQQLGTALSECRR